ncbi:MAG: hypothetical protein ACOH5I_26555 [Oligoflexus sp.]
MARRPHKLCARLTADERVIAEQRLAELGYKSVGHFVRDMLCEGRIHAARRGLAPAERTEIRRQLTGSFGRFSQLLKHLNQGQLNEINLAQETLEEVRRAVKKLSSKEGV